MPQITLTLNVTNEQLAALFAGNGGLNTQAPGSVAIKGRLVTPNAFDRSSTVPNKPGGGLGHTPSIVGGVMQYARADGDKVGVKPGGGYPPALNVRGMELVWKLYNQGYSYAEIGRAFAQVCSDQAIRRLVMKIKATKSESRGG